MLTELLVTMSIMGIILPGVLQVAMIPAVTQAKNANFQSAELDTLMYMTRSIKDEELAEVPDNCELTTDSEALLNYTIKCTQGSHSKTIAEASRSFTLYDVENGSNQTDTASLPVAPNMDYTPGVYCPPWDTNGTISFNAAHNVRCIPTDGTVDNGSMNGV